ncbi:MAG: hypothetical protein KAU94_06785 [Verrucomicrobia bacterium]|nr:hypothetical protein [Verrucomicrobiota bacterium]
MKKHHFLKKTGLVAMVVAMASLVQVQAVVDMAAATGTLADIAVMAVQAKANLAAAANSGDIDAIADATKRADAIDAALSEAQAALAATESAVAQNDEAAAAESIGDVDTAWKKANDALNGAVPEATPKSLKEQWKESTTNTGSGPGQAYDPPNIYDVPWQSAGLRAVYAAQFGNVYVSGGGSFANSTSFGDSDATPE